MDTERLKHCRLFTGDMEKHFENVYLRYAWHAERFYCEANAKQDAEGHEMLTWYEIDIKPYRDIPYPLLCHLFRVWANKLAGSSHPDVIVPGFHNLFMPAYLHSDRLQYCRYYTGDNSFERNEDLPFELYYIMHAEKFYVMQEDEEHAVGMFKDLGLTDLVTPELPLELLAQLFAIHNRNVQRASWDFTPLERVAESFRKRYLPKYLSGDFN